MTSELDQTSGGAKGNRFFTGAIILAIVGLLGLIGWGLANNSEERPQVGDPAPDVALAFFDGYGWETAEISPPKSGAFGYVMLYSSKNSSDWLSMSVYATPNMITP